MDGQTLQERLVVGHYYERVVGAWLSTHIRGVLPIGSFDNQVHAFGPKFYIGRTSISAPDFVIFNDGVVELIELKWKRHFSWHRASKSWQACMDARALEAYRRLALSTGCQVYVYFYCDGPEPIASDIANGSPHVCPTGLYRATLQTLCDDEDHRSEQRASGGRFDVPPELRGMVYWKLDTLEPMATCAEVKDAALGHRIMGDDP